jgi:tungstate transport system permease protein
MGDIWDGFVEAIKLIITFDPYVMKITLFTLYVCGVATLIGMLVGVPLGSVLALYRFRGRQLLVTLVNAGMGLAPVVVGLFVFLILKRRGPLGFLNWLFTPKAIVVAELILAVPLIAGITMAALQNENPKIRMQSKSLGAGEARSVLTLLRETRLSLMAAVIAGFGGIISEVGAAMIVGGNLLKGGEPYTRTLTTATVLEIGKGNATQAIALGIILLAITILLVYIMTLIQQGGLMSQPVKVARNLFTRRRGEASA